MDPKQYFKKLLPSPEKVRENKGLKFFGTLLHDPNIWHINRRSISGAVAIGFFFAWYPMPFQMICSALLAVWFRKNLPLATLSTLITNPITMPPMYYSAYLLGSKLMGHSNTLSDNSAGGSISFEWFFNQFSQIWQPLLLGCFILSVIFSITGYFLMRFIWRLLVIRKLKHRKNKHLHQKD